VALAMWKNSKKNRPSTRIISNPPITTSRTASAPIIHVPNSDNETSVISSDDDIQVLEDEINTPTKIGMRNSASLSFHQAGGSLPPKRKKQRISPPSPLTFPTMGKGRNSSSPPISSREEASPSRMISVIKRTRGGNGQEQDGIEGEDEIVIINDRNTVSKDAHTKAEVSAGPPSKFRPLVSGVKSKISYFNSKTKMGDGDPMLKIVKEFRVNRKDLLKCDQYQILGFSLEAPLTFQQQVAMKEITSTPIQAS